MTLSDRGWPSRTPHASKDELPTEDIWAVEAGTAGLPTSMELEDRTERETVVYRVIAS